MRNVLYLQADDAMNSFFRRMGAERFAMANGWIVRTAVRYSVDKGGICHLHRPKGVVPLMEMAAKWKLDGAVIEYSCRCGLPLLPSQFRTLPTVLIGLEKPQRRKCCSCIVRDESLIGGEAARELLVSGYADYAFVPSFVESSWCRARQGGFSASIRAAGKRLHKFAVPQGLASYDDMEPPLVNWLSTMPKPIGLFAANDRVGQVVIRACGALGIHVPDEVAVLGVDDEKAICESTEPTLSSIAQDFKGEGVAAMRLLSEMMDAPGKVFAPRKCNSATVVHRESTRFDLYGDIRVNRGMEFIRLRACEGIVPNDVAKAMFVSLTVAKDLFRRKAGTTILTEIHTVRLARAREMLAHGIPSDIVAQECGYGSVNDFRRVFKRYSGITIGKWLRGQ